MPRIYKPRFKEGLKMGISQQIRAKEREKAKCEYLKLVEQMLNDDCVVSVDKIGGFKISFWVLERPKFAKNL